LIQLKIELVLRSAPGTRRTMRQIAQETGISRLFCSVIREADVL